MREISIIYEKLDRVDGSAKFGFGAHALPYTIYNGRLTLDPIRGDKDACLGFWSNRGPPKP